MKRRYFKEKIIISADKRKLQTKVVHNFLKNSYWAKGIPIEVVKSEIKNSLCVGLYHNRSQIGYARIITDYTGFAYLCDVFIVEEYKGKGLSKRLMDFIINHPQLKHIKSWMLATKDAHGLYEKYGFKQLEEPQKYMQRNYFKDWNDRF